MCSHTQPTAALSLFLLHCAEAYASSQLYLQSARNRQTELEREKDSLEDKAASVEKELRHLMVQNSQLLSEATLFRLACCKSGRREGGTAGSQTACLLFAHVMFPMYSETSLIRTSDIQFILCVCVHL